MPIVSKVIRFIKDKCLLWRAIVSAEKFLSLFWAPEIGWLLVIFGVTMLGGWWNNHNFWIGFCSLFSLNTDIAGIGARVVSGVLFFVVWLIGGGVLVSVLVAQRRRRDNGEFRLFSWWKFSNVRKRLLKDHIVILGWDDNVPAIMKERMRENKFQKFVIVTMSKIDDVLRSIASIDIEDWRVLVYRGLYDDNIEWGHLEVGQTVAIYVIGEAHEESHDARVFLLARKIQTYIESLNLGNRNIPVFVNIVDFGLANKLHTGLTGNSTCTVKCFNFHRNSALNMLKRARSHNEQFTHIAIVGFGAMGKAIAVEVLCGKTGSIPFVVVTDADADKLKMEKTRFDNQFPSYKSLTREMPYLVFLESLETGRPRENWLVAIAKHRSEKGLGIVWDVLSATKGRENVKIVLNQEVKCDIWPDENQNSIEIDGCKIGLFGLKSGDIDGD